MRFLAALKREFLDLECGIRLNMIFGRAQAKFSIEAIHAAGSEM